MGNESRWFAVAFKFLGDLVGPRKALDPDPSAKDTASDLEPEARAVSPREPISDPEPTVSRDAPAEARRQEAPAEAIREDAPVETISPNAPTEAISHDAPVEDAVELDASPSEKTETPPVEQDDDSRRRLIRQLFNEYWAGVDDKPPTFAERLGIAEDYINERLAQQDVGWRLDARTREQLGLPSPRANRGSLRM
jgi:hypothetical protein